MNELLYIALDVT